MMSTVLIFIIIPYISSGYKTFEGEIPCKGLIIICFRQQVVDIRDQE